MNNKKLSIIFSIATLLLGGIAAVLIFTAKMTPTYAFTILGLAVITHIASEFFGKYKNQQVSKISKRISLVHIVITVIVAIILFTVYVLTQM